MGKTEKMIMAAAMMTAGIIGWNMYKKKNPDAVEDMKCMAKKTASKMLEKMENME